MKVHKGEESFCRSSRADKQIGAGVPECGIIEGARRYVIVPHLEEIGIGLRKQGLEQHATNDDDMEHGNRSRQPARGYCHAEHQERRYQEHIAQEFWLEMPNEGTADERKKYSDEHHRVP